MNSLARCRSMIPLLLTLLVLLPGGCARERGADDQDTLAPTSPTTSPGETFEFIPTTPKAVLDNLRTSVVGRNISAYTNLFTSDFFFEFSPQDINDPQNPAPAQWPLPDELVSAQHLFTSAGVEGITLSFVQSPAVPAYNEIPGAWKVQLSRVNLVVTLRQIGVPTVYRVADGTATIYLKPTGTVWGAPASRWRICRWKDGVGARGMSRGAARGTFRDEVMSWGRVKLLFR